MIEIINAAIVVVEIIGGSEAILRQ